MLKMSKREKDENLSDLELIRRCSKGESRAQELLYKRYFSFAMSICIRYTCDEHEAIEIVNDSYMKVLGKIDGFDSTREFKPWFGKILVNSAIDRYRQNSRNFSTISISDIEKSELHEPEIDSELSAADIISLFSKLPENYRVTFNLSEIEGYSHDEIGQMLGVTASTSRSNLTRARQILRELYRQNFTPLKKNHEAV